MNKKKLFLFGIIFFPSILFTVCVQDDKFESSEYKIQADQTLEKLNIENPLFIHSSNESVGTARIESGGIVITSVGQGNTAVYVSGSAAGLSNSARIQVYVEENGKINAEIHRYDDSNPVRPVVKQDVTIAGTVGNAIIPSQVNLMIDGTHFIAAVDEDVSSWITNLPPGLVAKISYIQEGDNPHEVYITVSRTPQSPFSGPLAITIPVGKTPTRWEVYVETRPGALFDIKDN